MGPDTRIDSFIGEEEQHSPPMVHGEETGMLESAALDLAARLSWLPDTPSGDTFAKRSHDLSAAFKILFEKVKNAFAKDPQSEDLLWLRDNSQQLSLAARQLAGELGPQGALPVVSNQIQILPRVLAIATGFLEQVGTDFSKEQFTAFCRAFEQHTPLKFHEIGALVPALKLILLEKIAETGKAVVKGESSATGRRVVRYILIFRTIAQTSWKEELESLLPFDAILRQDPAGAFGSMDAESQNLYREKIAQFALRSERTEVEVAKEALALAKRAQARRYEDSRIGVRESHIGYYLVAEGVTDLRRKIGYNPSFGERLRIWLRSNPDKFLLVGTAVLSLIIITGILWLLTPPTTPLQLVLLSMVILAIPSSQAAVQLMNYLTTNLLQPVILPKLDFSEGIPDDCVTLVAIPTLLLNEKQVQHLVHELEVRYAGNHDPNLHFAILSDLPDSPHPAPEDNELVDLCSRLITELNELYGAKKSGSFFHLHRHRVYNPREKGWMGWERKRGKLLDLNQLLRGRYDSFPVKIGNLSILPKVRFVITLDSDTELPRGSARRMVGAIAHPLNQAIVDPEDNIVVAGYGILQPRVDISVQCTASSRLAAIFAGETGLDPYSRASSDVYQDLYGEGSFTGKGIYEVDTMVRVLYGRFPRNSLLSHDLIEGAYARAGLASDISVIEDYPSHYSAYSRRKHRWLRGDWQIVEWLTDTVPDESGARVKNPISLVSRWKIFDNLRRSLVEPATCALLLYAWFVTDHPVIWTLAAICILFVPAWVEFCFGLTRAVVARDLGIGRDAVGTLFAANFTVLLTLTLLAHQTMLSLDAVARALVRRLVTRERLLEWETAAEAELGKNRTPIDRYIDWMPFFAVALGALIWFAHHHAFWAASPVIFLWACSKPLALWLNSSPVEEAPEIGRADSRLLHNSALYIWRYFAEFSSAEHNWLVPDNVQGNPLKITASISPTNVGLLLNARQAAVEFGYITVPEMVEFTNKTLTTVDRMEKYRGHLMNWYDTHTLQPKPPFFISSVDSGNMVASLWTLQQGCLDLLRRPLLSESLAGGLFDHLRVLVGLRAIPKKVFSNFESSIEKEGWLKAILTLPDDALEQPKPLTNPERTAEAEWFKNQTSKRIQNVRQMVRSYVPWLLPEFAELRAEVFGKRPIEQVPLERLADWIAEFELHLDQRLQTAKNGHRAVAEEFMKLLAEARENTLQLVISLRKIGRHAEEIADAMDFTFLVDKQRLLMSVGFDAGSKELQPYFYDLLATEPRTAVFVAIAKEDVPQEAWFRLDRPFASDRGRPVLVSWTGTMFEYLMPSIWMRSYRNTLLDRATAAAVRSQQEYASEKGIPWGISESACARINEAGDYHYEAFGVPTLALKKSESDPLIISPYSTFLALNVDRKNALANLRRMESLGWFGPYGFYEASDFTARRRRFRGLRWELVRSWMVHHQGMSLLSLANFLSGNVVQRWFHSHMRVKASELLLQEKSVARAA